MKKLHFSLLAILFALFAMVSFTACSSDDEDTPSTEDVQTNIIGMWQPTHVTGYDWDENDKPAKVDKDIEEEDCIKVLDVYTIQSINLTTMVLKYNLDGNASYPSTITFKKIK